MSLTEAQLRRLIRVELLREADHDPPKPRELQDATFYWVREHDGVGDLTVAQYHAWGDKPWFELMGYDGPIYPGELEVLGEVKPL